MFPCELVEQTAQPTLSIRFRAPAQELSAHFGRIYGQIITYLGQQGVAPAGPAFALYYNMEMADLDVEAGFPVARPVAGSGEIQAGTIPAGTYAICHYTGAYSGVAPAYDQLSTFVTKSGFEPLGPAYEWYLSDPSTPPAKMHTDITFPVRRIAHAQPV